MFTMMNMEHVKDLWCRWRSMCSLQGSLPSIASPFWMLPIRSARTFDSGAQTSKEQRPTPVFKSLRAAPVPCQFPYFERVLAPVVGNSDDTFQWERNLKDVLFLGSTSCFFFVFKSQGFVLCCLLFLLFICGIQDNWRSCNKVNLQFQGIRSFHISFNCHCHPVALYILLCFTR